MVSRDCDSSSTTASTPPSGISLNAYTTQTSPRETRRQLATIAIPTLGQLIAEPIFVIADSAFVGKISDTALASLSVGSTIILTAVGLCLFLAYSTTSRVSMLMGAGLVRKGLQAGVGGIWLAAGIGIALTVFLSFAAGPLVYAMQATGDTAQLAVSYVYTAGVGITGTLIAFATNGIFRGVGKAMITVWSAVCAAVVNVLLDILFIFVFHWSVAGSGIATGISQWVMCAILIAYLIPIMRTHKVTWKPDLHLVKQSAGDGIMLFWRTLALRIGLVATVMVATSLGEQVLASYQGVNSSWNLALNILDAIGVGGQALIGAALGAHNIPRVKELLREIERAGIIWGVGVGVCFAAFGWWFSFIFTNKPSTASIISLCMVCVGAFFPFNGWLWALDGVLIGAGDYLYLAIMCSIATISHISALGIALFAFSVSQPSTPIQAATLWLIFNIVFMGIRGIGNIRRAHGDTWIALALRRAE